MVNEKNHPTLTEIVPVELTFVPELGIVDGSQVGILNKLSVVDHLI